MRGARLWQDALGLADTVVERVELEAAGGVVVVSVRPVRRAAGRCGRCGTRAGGYDRGAGRRRWRALDVGELRCVVEADAPRVACPAHGPTVGAVPWARYRAGHTRSFDDYVAWLAAHAASSTAGDLARVSWRTVGSIVARVVADGMAARDPLEGLARIGIDEVSHRRGQRYLTVVVDHDTARLVWAAPGRDKATLAGFFAALGPRRCAQIALVSGDAAPYIALTARQFCPQATFCTDPFHVVSWATRALDTCRRAVWNQARRGGDAAAPAVKGARWALLKNPEDLTGAQRDTLAALEQLNAPLYRAYLLKEQLRAVFATGGAPAVAALETWITAAAGSQLAPFTALAAQIATHRRGITAALTHGLSNGVVESTNAKIRLILRVGYGFHNPHAVVALAMLARGGYCPPLPGRAALPPAELAPLNAA